MVLMRLINLARFYSSKQGQILVRLFIACRVFTVWKLKGLQPAAIVEVESKLKIIRVLAFILTNLGQLFHYCKNSTYL